MAKRRTRYSTKVKQEVVRRYKLCRTTPDKVALARELGITDDDGNPSISKLYNLASRLEAAGQDLQPGEHKEAHDPERLMERDDPRKVKFDSEADRYLTSEFGRSPIEDIAYHLKRSETAVLYRARHLGLRKPVKYWRVEKVSRWFSMTEEEFEALTDEGIDIYPLTDKVGRIQLKVVSTSSIARWMRTDDNEKRLRHRKADQFFIKEIKECVRDLTRNKTTFESCKFLSHGHVCMNPRSDFSYGLYCTNNERYAAGEDPRCLVRILEVEDLAPEED